MEKMLKNNMTSEKSFLCDSLSDTYHINHKLPQALSLPFGEVLEDVTVLLMEQLKPHSQVVVLQNRLIVIHQGQF